jgi:ankyrin repeat protein
LTSIWYFISKKKKNIKKRKPNDEGETTNEGARKQRYILVQVSKLFHHLTNVNRELGFHLFNESALIQAAKKFDLITLDYVLRMSDNRSNTSLAIRERLNQNKPYARYNLDLNALFQTFKMSRECKDPVFIQKITSALLDNFSLEEPKDEDLDFNSDDDEDEEEFDPEKRKEKREQRRAEAKTAATQMRTDIIDELAFCFKRACFYRYIDLFKLLLAHPTMSSSLNDILSLAVAHSVEDAVKLLLAENNERMDPSKRDNEAIRLACNRRNEEIIKLLLADKRVDPSVGNGNCIMDSIAKGDLKSVTFLLGIDKRIDPSCQQNKPIIFASNAGHLEIVKLLLKDPRVNPADQDNRAIVNASEKGHKEVVELLLADKRVDPSVRKNRALTVARVKNFQPIVELLMKDPRVQKVEAEVKAEAAAKPMEVDK